MAVSKVAGSRLRIWSPRQSADHHICTRNPLTWDEWGQFSHISCCCCFGLVVPSKSLELYQASFLDPYSSSYHVVNKRDAFNQPVVIIAPGDNRVPLAFIAANTYKPNLLLNNIIRIESRLTRRLIGICIYQRQDTTSKQLRSWRLNNSSHQTSTLNLPGK